MVFPYFYYNLFLSSFPYIATMISSFHSSDNPGYPHQHKDPVSSCVTALLRLLHPEDEGTMILGNIRYYVFSKAM